MALGRSSRFQSNFAAWLVYFMMHRFKFTEKGEKDGPHVRDVQYYAKKYPPGPDALLILNTLSDIVAILLKLKITKSTYIFL